MTDEGDKVAVAATADGDTAKAPGTTSGSSKKPKKVVERPVPPPAVTTAYLILRGALTSVVGASLSEAKVTVTFQPTFVKDAPALTGKFGINLGKKNGTLASMEIPDTPELQDKLLDAIEQAANAIIQENHNIQVVNYKYSSEENDNNDKWIGDCALDSTEAKKAKNGDMFKVAMIENVVVSTFPGGSTLGSTVYNSTNCVKSIQLDRSPIGCSITSSAKSKKCDIALKFEVQVADHVAAGQDRSPFIVECSATDVTPYPSMDKYSNLMKEEIRREEGQNYVSEVCQLQSETKDIAEGTANENTVAKEKEPNDDDEMVVNAWEVKGVIDYDKLVNEFGSKLIDDELLKRFELLTVGKGTVPYLHRFLRRNIFFSHRDLDRICDCLEANLPIYLYTGRGPSSGAMHLGHLIPFEFTQWLQRALQCPLVIQMTDDEKFIFKGNYTDEEGDNLEWYQHLTMENAKDILACGFLKEKTFIFSDLDYVGTMYPNICRIWKAVTSNNVNNIFGFDGTANIGKIAFPAVQAAPSFSSSFPVVLHGSNAVPDFRKELMTCLIPCAIDQDPYFRMTRDVSHKLVPRAQMKQPCAAGGGTGHPTGGKPALIHSKFFPPLQGAKGKMSASDTNSAVFLTDTQQEISDKIHKFAFSGGQDTKALQEELGANLDQDVAYQWLKFFLEDDELLEQIGSDYSSGKGEFWSTRMVKTKLVEVLQELVRNHQSRRAAVTEDIVREWMVPRPLL